MFGRELPAAHYVVIGTDTAVFVDMLLRQGLPREAVSDLSRLDAPALWQGLVELVPDGGMVVGVGNIAGIGHALLDHLRARSGAA